jgi:hypothetical protein
MKHSEKVIVPVSNTAYTSVIRLADNQDEPEYDPPRWGETGRTSKEPQQKCPYCGHDLNIKVE